MKRTLYGDRWTGQGLLSGESAGSGDLIWGDAAESGLARLNGKDKLSLSLAVFISGVSSGFIRPGRRSGFAD